MYEFSKSAIIEPFVEKQTFVKPGAFTGVLFAYAALVIKLY
jgi:hypothetical protein